MLRMTFDILPILRKASAAIMDIYQDESKFKTELKDDHSPLTEADKRANAIIEEGLNQAFPGVPIISEETQQETFETRKHYHQYFLVDPLDGTKEFIKRNGEFTVNIAYMEGNSPAGGFVYVPATGMAYMAEKGLGAFKIDLNNHSLELRSTPFHLSDNGIHVVASRSHRDVETEKIISQLQQPEIVFSGSSLKFLLIAEGHAHFYPRLAPTMEWDTAAAQCILEESGGSVLEFPKLTPLVYNKENLLNPYFLAIGSLLDPESLVDLMIQFRQQ